MGPSVNPNPLRHGDQFGVPVNEIPESRRVGLQGKRSNRVFDPSRESRERTVKAWQAMKEQVFMVSRSDHFSGNVSGSLVSFCGWGLGIFHDNLKVAHQVVQFLPGEDLPIVGRHQWTGPYSSFSKSVFSNKWKVPSGTCICTESCPHFVSNPRKPLPVTRSRYRHSARAFDGVGSVIALRNCARVRAWHR